MNIEEFITALKGERVIRKKIYITPEAAENLQFIKKELDSCLNLPEIGECCFDYYDFKTIPDQDLEKFFSQKKKGVQLRIREDIYNYLVELRKRSNTSIQYIMSYIIIAQSDFLRKYLRKDK